MLFYCIVYENRDDDSQRVIYRRVEHNTLRCLIFESAVRSYLSVLFQPF